MLQFSATDLGNKTGDVLAAAAQAPVVITRHGKRRFVMLTTESFERYRELADPRIARRIADIPPEEGAELAVELTRIVESDE